MAATPIPLNTFLSTTGSLTTTPLTLYRTPINVSTIVLSAAIANISTTTQTLGMHILKSGDNSTRFYIVSGSGVAKGESINPLPGKIILQQGDSIQATAGASNGLQVILSLLETAIV